MTDTKMRCILLVDDDEPTNILHQIIIEESGVTNKIVVAQTGFEALEYLQKCYSQPEQDKKGMIPPDLILLDINMPGMNGFEFLEKYKQLPDYMRTGVVIVMLTTSLNPYDMKKLKVLGVTGLKNKPLTENMLREILSEYFP